MRKFLSMGLALTLLASLSACGNTYMGRALTGGAIGTAAGTAGAIIMDANPVTGALLGMAGGMAVGVMTSRGDDPRFY